MGSSPFVDPDASSAFRQQRGYLLLVVIQWAADAVAYG